MYNASKHENNGKLVFAVAILTLNAFLNYYYCLRKGEISSGELVNFFFLCYNINFLIVFAIESEAYYLFDVNYVEYNN